MVELFILKEEDIQVLDVPTDYTTWNDGENSATNLAVINGNIVEDNQNIGMHITKQFSYDKEYQYSRIDVNIDKQPLAVNRYALIYLAIDTSANPASLGLAYINISNGTISSSSNFNEYNIIDNGDSFTFTGIYKEARENIVASIFPAFSTDGVSYSATAQGSITINSISLRAYNVLEDLKADLYKDETIQLTDTIQDVRDIAKVFTPYTQSFKLPASATNNKLFKHYYNADIDGFDARYRTDALIKIDGVDYRKGKIALNKVDLKDGQAVSYDVNFFGNTVALTELLGEDELKDLVDTSVMSGFGFNVSASAIKDGLSDGYDSSDVVSQSNNPNLIYPFISGKNYYYYDSANSGSFSFDLPDGAEVRNINDDGINYLDLKPALKVSKVLEAIEEKYNISFSNDFFGDTDLTELYLWLHNKKGNLEEQLQVINYRIPIDDLVFESGTDLRPFDNDFELVQGVPDIDYDKLDFTVESIGSGFFGVAFEGQWSDGLDVDLVENPVLTNVSGDSVSVSFQRGSVDASFSGDIVLRYYGDISSFKLSNITATRVGGSGSGTYSYNSGQYFQTEENSNIFSFAPKIKTIDFLKSLFKMFNLTTYFNGSSLVVQTLDNYYASGNTYDITKYIDTSNHTVSRSNVYRNVSFEFPEAKTFAVYNSNLLTGDEFGNEDFEDRDIDGGTYEVKVDFEKMQYERMTNQETDILTGYQWGWFCDENKNTYVNKPLLLYAEKITATLKFYDGSTASDVTTYFMPRNIKADGLQTLHFGSENDEFTALENTNSLFVNYYSKYIEDVFNKKARIYNFTAYLPSHIVNRYELNDTFIIAGREYIINSIKINLLNNKAELELLNKV